MTVLTNQPDNVNPLQPSKFLMTFPRLKGTQYFCQEVNIPGVSIGSIEQPTTFVNLPVPGNKITFESFTMTFMVDEDLLGWRQVQEWIHSLGIATSWEDYKDLPRQLPMMNSSRQPQYSDGTLTILSGLNNAKWRVNFKDMFPTDLSGINFSTKESADTILTATASFKYGYYSIEKA